MKKIDTASITIATVFANLLNRNLVIRDLDDSLVIDALRRSSLALQYASLSDLGNYLQQMDPQQLKGVASNVKGIFHELKYVDYINSSDLGWHAEIYQSTNHAGADIRITDKATGTLLREIQLKATDSVAYVQQHIDRYPHIDVFTTSEVSEAIPAAESTGFLNADLAIATNDQLDRVGDMSVQSQLEDAMQTSGLLSAAFQASQVFAGKKVLKEATKDALVNIGIATSTTALVAFLFG